MTAPDNGVFEFAARLRLAEQRGVPTPLIFGDSNRDLSLAYDIQRRNIENGLSSGRRLAGRKIGLTDKVLQKSLGISAPIFGALFADMGLANGGEVAITRVMAAKVEPEVALILSRDIEAASPTVDNVLDYVAFAMPALEIIGSRFPPGEATVADDIADNCGSGLFVVGPALPGLLGSQQVLTMMIGREGETQSQIVEARIDWEKILNATACLAAAMAAEMTPLRRGDVVLTGAVIAERQVQVGDCITAAIDGYPAASVSFVGPKD